MAHPFHCLVDSLDVPYSALKGVNTTAVDVGGAAFKALHTHRKPLEFGVLGHYRVSHRVALVNAQAANSRLFEMRNSGTNLIIPTRLRIQWLQTAAHTAAIEDSIDVYRCTGFTVVDSVNVVTPAAFQMRTSMAAAPGGAVFAGCTVAGAAAGMTGGTLTKAAQPFAQVPQWLLAAVPTASVVTPIVSEIFFEDNDEHPLVLAQNEGIEVENRVLLGAAAGSTLYVDFAYAEVVSF